MMMITKRRWWKEDSDQLVGAAGCVLSSLTPLIPARSLALNSCGVPRPPFTFNLGSSSAQKSTAEHRKDVGRNVRL